jgi:hypothetical protein
MKPYSRASITAGRRPAPGRTRPHRAHLRAGGGTDRDEVHQPAAAHLDDAVGQPGEALRVVADVDDGDPLDLHQVLERVAQHRPALGVDTGGRLVEHQHPGLRDERPGDERPLLLAAGQLAQPRVRTPSSPIRSSTCSRRCS